MPMENIIILTFLWLLYFLSHSLLASDHTKKILILALPSLASYYRLLYNLLAIVLLLPLLYFIYYIPSDILWQREYGIKILFNLMALLALVGFLWSLKFYSSMDFLGFKQHERVTRSIGNQLVLSPLHRFVRHPWYFFALVLIWTRDMNVHFFVSSVLMTAYFFIGSHLEEKKLVSEFGVVYEKYQRYVPRLIPSFRRYLNNDKMAELKIAQSMNETK